MYFSIHNTLTLSSVLLFLSEIISLAVRFLSLVLKMNCSWSLNSTAFITKIGLLLIQQQNKNHIHHITADIYFVLYWLLCFTNDCFGHRLKVIECLPLSINPDLSYCFYVLLKSHLPMFSAFSFFCSTGSVDFRHVFIICL